jgi:predicted GIY-YIG superfamily endonuclease
MSFHHHHNARKRPYESLNNNNTLQYIHHHKEKKNITIYVLLCEKNRYYVGKTNRPINTRIEEHFSQYGSEWTCLYKPIKVIEIITNADDMDEDKYTKIYMKKYGIDNVRGGTYSRVNLPEHQVMTLQEENCTAENACFRCGRKNHFVSQCYARTDIHGQDIDDEEEEEEEEDYEDHEEYDLHDYEEYDDDDE